MRSTKNRPLCTIVASLALATTLLTGCGAPAQSGQTAQSDAPASSQSAQSDSSSQDVPEATKKAITGEGIVSKFIGEKFYNKKVTNENEALEAIKSVYDRIGADSSVVLELNAVRPVDGGNTYYIFQQRVGDVLAFGASVKLIVNKDGDVVALASSILPNVKVPESQAKIDAKKAEEIAVQHSKDTDSVDAKVVPNATEQTIITVPSTTDRYAYAWVVYTQNYLQDTAKDMGYLAHYIDSEGEHLYALPISEPHNADAIAGDKAAFDFDKFKQDTWKGTVTLHDGKTKEISVPVLSDPDTKAMILGDAKRRILCVDYAQYNNEEQLDPRVGDGTDFDNTELLAYESFIRVWDFYDSIGWTAPDGEGTPTLLLMDYVDEKGERQDEAYYTGKKNGFQTFTFNRVNPDGENLDVIAHEFTHCVTSTTMITNVYNNDMGAINEGMSDVLGNLIQMIVENKPEEAWLMGSGSGKERTLRNMKDPHEYRQPEYTWDTFYTPHVITPTNANDMGGVHINSSLLNKLSYRLDQSGMSPKEQFDLWLAVALTMTPHTDYPQMAELLPWCLEDLGYSKHSDALKTAIDEAKLTLAEEPDSMPQGNGRISFVYPSAKLGNDGEVRVNAVAKDSDKPITTYPAANTNKVSIFLPAGEYKLICVVGENNAKKFIYRNDKWEQVETVDISTMGDDTLVKVEEGKTSEPSTQGLPESL